MTESHNQWNRLSRRKLLALTGTAGIGVLAGCSGGNNPDNPGDIKGATDESSSDLDSVGDYEKNMSQLVPSGAVNPYDGEYIFNPYHTSWNPGDAQEMSYEYLAVYNTAKGEFIPRVGKEWSHKDGVSTVTLNEDYAWSDGTPVTAKDFVTNYKLAIYMEQPISEFLNPDGVRTTGEYSFELQPKKEFSNIETNLWYNQWLESVVHTPASHFGEFVKKFDNASSDSEIKSIRQEVINYDPHWDEMVFSGPFVYIEANEEYADQVPNPHHPIAKDFGFYQRHGVYEDEAGLRAGEVDYHHQSSTLKQLPKKYDSPPVAFSGQSFALLYGPEDEFIKNDPRVRKALAFAINTKKVVKSTKKGTPVDKHSGGIGSGYINHFVKKDVLSSMTNYVPRDTERARTLLEDAGFSKNSGSWHTPDGTKWKLNFPVGNWFSTPSQLIADNLSQFGINVDHYVDEMATWNAEVEQNLNYDISLHLDYGRARQYHAYPDLENVYFGSKRGAVNEVGSLAKQVEVPKTGNPNSATTKLDIRKTLDKLSVAGSQKEVTNHATRLSWAHNQLLPGVQLFPWSEFYWVNAGEWNFDLETDVWKTSNRIAHYFLQNGLQQK